MGTSVLADDLDIRSLLAFCFLIQKLCTEKRKNNCFHCLNFGNSQQNKYNDNFVVKTEEKIKTKIKWAVNVSLTTWIVYFQMYFSSTYLYKIPINRQAIKRKSTRFVTA
jgi:hypothetical protein